MVENTSVIVGIKLSQKFDCCLRLTFPGLLQTQILYQERISPSETTGNLGLAEVSPFSTMTVAFFHMTVCIFYLLVLH